MAGAGHVPPLLRHAPVAAGVFYTAGLVELPGSDTTRTTAGLAGHLDAGGITVLLLRASHPDGGPA
ncbi:hypothetical protein [Streptomyces chartreusis]|uniref:hypothetical protein n=1 Tax=Streptomyces chartreusis TaxID=1969 RepID=UPI0033A7755A